MTDSGKYHMDFTTGGLFLPESLTLAQTYLECKNWEQVRNHCLEKNIPGARSHATLQTITGIVIRRLRTLDEAETEQLINATEPDRIGWLWVATCRRHNIIADFMIHVIREHFLRKEYTLPRSEFDYFLMRQEDTHEELAKLAESTRRKRRNVLFNILKEADIITPEHHLLPSPASPAILRPITAKKPDELHYFLLTPSKLKLRLI